MIKRIISLILAFVILSGLLCATVSAASGPLFNTTATKITPMFETSGCYYRVTLVLNVVKNTGNDAYLALYNNKGRMIDIIAAPVQPRIVFDITPEEYPLTIKGFAWVDNTMTPLGEYHTMNLASANQIIVEQLGNFVISLKSKFSMPDGSFMYELTRILDSIDEQVIEDAKDDSLLIDKKFLQERYPEAYAEFRSIAKELKETEGSIDQLITQFSQIIDNNEAYEQLAITLFTLLGVFDYI